MYVVSREIIRNKDNAEFGIALLYASFPFNSLLNWIKIIILKETKPAKE